MKLYSNNEEYKLYQGNMLDMLEVIEANSIDSIVCDPPYGLTSITKRFGKENSAECKYGKDGSFARLSRGFMGKEWDGSGIEYNIETWQKCYEVLKPGGYLLAFGGSRTFHRIACAIEDAGFEIRDTIMWLYGSGFPKSMDISKQIDKMPNRSRKNMIRIGEIIKENRNKNNLTQRQLGELIGVSRELINLYEIKGNNQQQIPTQEQWSKIKEVLKLNDDMDFIFEEAEREVIGKGKRGQLKDDMFFTKNIDKAKETGKAIGYGEWDITVPSTDLAKQWNGWGTALKPSFEPIIVARKPFKGSLVDNVIEYGVGGINIDECRVGNEHYEIKNGEYDKPTNNAFGHIKRTPKEYNGRFPANTILTYDETDFDEVCGGFPNTKSKGSNANFEKINQDNPSHLYTNIKSGVHFEDSGSASRYFYCAKASKKDRDEGLDEFEEKYIPLNNQATAELKRGNVDFEGKSAFCKIQLKKNTHPTVKPTELMQYLIRLVTPKNGTILDPFNGSGSTGKAVMYENKERNKNYKYIGIELTEEYLPISKARIEYVYNLQEKEIKNMQMSIFDLYKGE